MTKGLRSLEVNGGRRGHEDRGRESDRIGKQREGTTWRITGYADKLRCKRVRGTRCNARGVLQVVQGSEQDQEQDQE